MSSFSHLLYVEKKMDPHKYFWPLPNHYENVQIRIWGGGGGGAFFLRY